jgi:glycosyltransferase involved in cell wall biosynthesis
VKIAFFADSVYAHLSGLPCFFCGAERQQWLLGRALAASGWRVTFGVQEGLALGRRAEIDGLEFVGIGRGRALAAWRRFLLAERPDWWYWRGAYHLWGAGVEVAKLAGVGTIFAAAFDSDVEPRRALSMRRRWWRLYAWGLSRTDKILVQHQGQLTGLAERWRSKAAVVYSIAGPISDMKPHSEREAYVAWVGQLRQPKRPDLLIEIARNAPGIRFVVCGAPTNHRSTPGYGERIQQTLEAVPNVEYLGFVAPARAEQVIAGASVLLSTSDAEGFPNTFLQAWAAGTPVLSLGIDPDAIIERAGLGIVSRGVESAATDIKALVDSPRSRQEMGLRARRHVAQAHSEESIVASFERAIGCAGAVRKRGQALSVLENPR